MRLQLTFVLLFRFQESGQEQRYEQLTGGGTILESSLHEVCLPSFSTHTFSLSRKLKFTTSVSQLYRTSPSTLTPRSLFTPSTVSTKLNDGSRSSLFSSTQPHNATDFPLCRFFSSFLYIRVLQNPRFYSKQLGDASKSSLSPSQALEKFVAVSLLLSWT